MLLVEFFKAVAWPVVTALIALGYKPEIVSGLPAFLRRKIAIEGFGVKASIDAAEQQKSSAENPAQESLAQTSALSPRPRKAVNILELHIGRDLDGFASDRREPALIRALAERSLVAGHEFTYNRIFGSQIAGLKRLDEVGVVTVEQARAFYQPYGENFPQIYSNYGFDGWLGFLRINNLVNQNGSSLQLSDFGKDFLIYLTEKGLTESKAW